MFSCVSALTAVRAESLIKPVETERFALPRFAKVGRSLTAPRAGALGHGNTYPPHPPELEARRNFRSFRSGHR